MEIDPSSFDEDGNCFGKTEFKIRNYEKQPGILKLSPGLKELASKFFKEEQACEECPKTSLDKI